MIAVMLLIASILFLLVCSGFVHISYTRHKHAKEDLENRYLINANMVKHQIRLDNMRHEYKEKVKNMAGMK